MNYLNDIAAEEATLTGLIVHGKDAYLDVSDLITSTTFTSYQRQNLFSTLAYIRSQDLERSIDFHTIISSAKELGIANDLGDVRSFMSETIERENLRGFAKKLKKLEIARGLVGKLDDSKQEIINTITGAELLTEIVSKAETPIFDFINELTLDGHGGPEQIGVGIDEYLKDLVENPRENMGIPTGDKIYDEIIGGLREGVHVITARTKSGKSMLGINKGLYVAAKEKSPVLYLDTELDQENGQWARMLARISGIETKLIETGKFGSNPIFKAKVNKAANILKSIPFMYMNISGKIFDEVVSIVRRWVLQAVGYDNRGKTKPCLLIYDYLKLNSETELGQLKEYEVIGYRMNQLHELTNKYGLPCLTFYQENKEMQAGIDRVNQYCTSICSFRVKEEAELVHDGRENGTRKLIPIYCRFGEGLEPGDYINYHLNGRIATTKEGKTRNELGRQRQLESPAEEIVV